MPSHLRLQVARYILPHLNQSLPEPEPIDSALLHMDIVTTLERLRPKLTVLWDIYLQQQQQQYSSGHDSPINSQSGSSQSDRVRQLYGYRSSRTATDVVDG